MGSREPFGLQAMAAVCVVLMIGIPAVLLVDYVSPETVRDAAGVTARWGLLALGLGPLLLVAVVGYAYLRMESISRRIEEQQAYKRVKLEGWAEGMEEDIEGSIVAYEGAYEPSSFYAGRYPF